MTLKLNDTYVKSFIKDGELEAISAEVEAAHKCLLAGNGEGNDFLGWVDLPFNYDKEEYARIKAAAAKIQKKCDVFVVIGIGGSYLGARAVIEYVKSPLYNNLKHEGTPDIYFSGCNISAQSLNELLAICEGKDICINVISKSGTTTEPAVAFRVFRELLEKKYGKEEAKERIFVTTDKARGTLKKFSDEAGYETFVVPDNVGGRFSVLTAVGLLPIAVSGTDIDALMKGAADAATEFKASADINTNPCMKYVALRNIMYRNGKGTEILVNYEPYAAMLNEWWKQLYGESEGKDKKGIFPASVIFSTDLHSLGQFIQDGSRNIFETVVSVNETNEKKPVPFDEANVDGLNFLAGVDLNEVNKMAMKGTILAHVDGGTPNILIEVADKSEYSLGYLLYFFEFACGVSGYVLGVNPFNQPGVEAYKKNMFALLGKPGYESEKAALEARLK
ncbi:MAG: glucose-6-phosphate isomerase [Clostridia bacterium]|jgi:glucose-6-phosphate isomerase|nr:glucose-6-phosphate isomerase [Clostridia bacterium]